MTVTEIAAARVAPPAGRKRPARAGQTRAVLIFVVPFGVLFTLFYLIPIGYAVVQSLYTVERTGTFGPAREVFGGLAQYERVFTDGPFWTSVGRVLAFGVVQVPVMLGPGPAAGAAARLRPGQGAPFFRLAFFVPYAVPGVIAAIMWGFLYSPNLSPFTALTSNVDFLSADLVLWAMANVVTWVYVGYNMLIIYSSLLSIPTEIYEAARLDGAGQFRIAWSVKIPLVDAGDRADHRLLDHRHPAAARRTAGVPQLQLGRVEHLHAEPHRLLHLVRAELQPRGGVLGRAGAGHVRAVVRLPQGHPAPGASA